eukprot:11218323-Lingulodinium_polyedra.AAC.1
MPTFARGSAALDHLFRTGSFRLKEEAYSPGPQDRSKFASVRALQAEGVQEELRSTEWGAHCGASVCPAHTSI